MTQIFDQCDDKCPPEPIVPAACIVAPVTWDIESLVEAAQWLEVDRVAPLPGCLFVPARVRSQVPQLGHSSFAWW